MNRLLILGPEKRSDTEIGILERSKEYFDTVLYVPLPSVRIEAIGDKSIPYYKNTNLFDFDVVLARIKRKDTDIGYVLLKLLEDNGVHTPSAYKSVLYSYNKFLSPIFLKSKGLSTPKVYFATTRKAIEHILPDLKYPVYLHLPYENKGSVYIDSYDSAKGVIDTIEKLSQPIFIQEIYPNSNILSILVIGKALFCIDEKDKIYTLTSEEKYTIRKASNLFETDFCQIKAIKHNSHLVITGMNVCPSINKYQDIFDEDLYDIICKHVAKTTEKHTKLNSVRWLFKILGAKK